MWMDGYIASQSDAWTLAYALADTGQEQPETLQQIFFSTTPLTPERCASHFAHTESGEGSIGDVSNDDASSNRPPSDFNLHDSWRPGAALSSPTFGPAEVWV